MTSYPQPSSYPAYPVQYPSYGQPAQYAPHFIQQPAQGFQPMYNFAPPASTTPPQQSSGEPDFPSITQQVASQAIHRLAVAQLKSSEFDAIEPAALHRLELEVVAFIRRLFDQSHEYANLANRATPIATDMFQACEDHGMKTKDLRQVATSLKRDTAELQEPSLHPVEFVPPPSRSASPELLSSDDEDAPPTIPVTLRMVPSHFPSLPPKHTYLKTPASPPKKAALPSLEKKLKNAGLVQESLKNLLLATEDNLGQEDGELLGHIVNWEASTYSRKRWKIGS